MSREEGADATIASALASSLAMIQGSLPDLDDAVFILGVGVVRNVGLFRSRKHSIPTRYIIHKSREHEIGDTGMLGPA